MTYDDTPWARLLTTAEERAQLRQAARDAGVMVFIDARSPSGPFEVTATHVVGDRSLTLFHRVGDARVTVQLALMALAAYQRSAA